MLPLFFTVCTCTTARFRQRLCYNGRQQTCSGRDDPVKENKRSVLSDERGNFVLQRLLPGTYHLEISFTGYETLLKGN